MNLHPTWLHHQAGSSRALDSQPALEALFETEGARAGVADRVVLIDDATRLDASAVTDSVKRVAGALAESGVGRGDAVSFQIPSWWETLVLYRACWRLGAIASPIHHAAADADVAAVLAAVEPAVVIAAAHLPAARVPDAIRVRGEDDQFGELLTAAPHDQIDADPDDLAVVLFTSGSSGTAKGVLHTNKGLAYKASGLQSVHGIDQADVILMPAPMAHISGLCNAVLVPGAGGLTSVLMDRWNPRAAVDLISAEQVTFMMGPPTFFQTMMGAPNFTESAVRSMRLISCGGAGVTPGFVAEAEERFGAVVKRTYGSTEAPVVATWHAGDPPERTGSSDGRAIGEVTLRVIGPATGDAAPLRAGAAGELVLAGPELFVGYADTRRNEDAILDDTWYRTGDLAWIDADGWLHIEGRLDDTIIRGGENISAAEVERCLEAHADVAQAVAVGFADDRLGERVCAFVVCVPGADFDLDACSAWFETRGVTKYKWPERLVQLDEMPVLPTSGKPDRAVLRDRTG